MPFRWATDGCLWPILGLEVCIAARLRSEVDEDNGPVDTRTAADTRTFWVDVARFTRPTARWISTSLIPRRRISAPTGA